MLKRLGWIFFCSFFTLGLSVLITDKLISGVRITSVGIVIILIAGGIFGNQIANGRGD